MPHPVTLWTGMHVPKVFKDEDLADSFMKSEYYRRYKDGDLVSLRHAVAFFIGGADGMNLYSTTTAWGAVAKAVEAKEQEEATKPIKVTVNGVSEE